MSDTHTVKDPLTTLTAHIVSAYVGKHVVPTSEVASLIAQVHLALGTLGTSQHAPAEPEKPVPAVSIRKSVQDEYLICLEDGQKFKSLKRHLMTHHGMIPDDYRAKWGLPATYPMVAPSYAARRSELAKSIRLGQVRKAATASHVDNGSALEAPESAPRKSKQKTTGAIRKARSKAKPAAEAAE